MSDTLVQPDRRPIRWTTARMMALVAAIALVLAFAGPIAKLLIATAANFWLPVLVVLGGPMLSSPDRRLRVQQVVLTAYPMIAVGMAHAAFLLRPWLPGDQGLRLLLGCLVLGTCTVIPLVLVGALVVLNNSMTEWRRRPQGLAGG